MAENKELVIKKREGYFKIGSITNIGIQFILMDSDSISVQYINEHDAQQIIDHLKKKFNLK